MSKKFFTPEDFDWYIKQDSSLKGFNKELSDFVNAKLERESRTVYCEFPKDSESTLDLIKFSGATHRARLINIEDIERCTHPKEKVELENGNISWSSDRGIHWKCECGANVQPKEFEEIK